MEDESVSDLWLHLHIHLAQDHVFGGTRVVANPRGYLFGNDNDFGNGFNPRLLIELDEYRPKPPGM